MITSVKVYNESGVLLELPMDDSTEYLVKDISGLGPVKATINTTDYVGMDGGVYQSAKGGQRNIVMQLGLNPSYADADPFGTLRRGLYPWFTPKMRVTLEIVSSNMETVTIAGFVESFEPTIFSTEPQQQISIICPDPFFYSKTRITALGTGPGQLTITNPGTAKVGVLFAVDNISSVSGQIEVTRGSSDPNAPVSSGSVDGWAPGQRSVYSGPLYLQGELLFAEVNSVKGEKSAVYGYSIDYDSQQLPPPVFTNVIGWVDGWLELVPGTNLVNMAVINDTYMGQAVFHLSFLPRYIGL